MRRDIKATNLEDLTAIWADNAVDEKLAAGLLNSITAADARTTNPLYAGARSRIIKVLAPKGRHIGTYHEILAPDSSILHRHPKDYTLRDCTRVRLAGQRSAE
ncbi:MAG: hypothetical protein ABI939_02295 [Anaerolineaceae bacterium]